MHAQTLRYRKFNPAILGLLALAALHAQHAGAAPSGCIVTGSGTLNALVSGDRVSCGGNYSNANVYSNNGNDVQVTVLGNAASNGGQIRFNGATNSSIFINAGASLTETAVYASGTNTLVEVVGATITNTSNGVTGAADFDIGNSVITASTPLNLLGSANVYLYDDARLTAIGGQSSNYAIQARNAGATVQDVYIESSVLEGGSTVVDLGAGDDVLTLRNGVQFNTPSGNPFVTGGQDNDTLNLEQSGNDPARFIHFETLNMNGIHWVASVATLDQTNVNSGLLEVVRAHTGDATVADNAQYLLRDGGLDGTISLADSASLILDGSLANVAPMLGSAVTVAGTGTLRKAGSGSYTLLADLAAGIDVKIDAGELDIRSGAGFADNAVEIAANAALHLNSADDITFGSLIYGGGSLAKFGEGNLSLTASNAFQGGTTVAEGGLLVTDINTLGSGAVQVDAAGLLSLNLGADTLLPMAVNGTGAINKLGSGSLSFNPNSRFSGSLTIDDGTLLIDNSAVFAGASLINNSLLEISNSLANDISGTGRIDVNAQGPLELSGTNTHSGGTRVLSGSLQGEADAFGSGAIEVNGANLVVMANSDATLVNNVSGTGAMRKVGSGILTVDGTLSQQGALAIEAGGVATDDVAKLGTGVSIGGGTTLIIDQAADAVSGSNFRTTGNAATFIKRGQGSLSLTTAGGLGNASIEAGRLAFNADITADVNVAATAVLGGAGQVIGDVTNAGRLAPGNSIGTLTIDGDYTHGSNAILEIEYDATGNDLLAITGNANLNGGVVEFVPLATAESSGMTFLTADGSVTGSFDSARTDTGAAVALDHGANAVGTEVMMIKAVRPTTIDSQVAVSSLAAQSFSQSLFTQLERALHSDTTGLWAQMTGASQNQDRNGDTLGFDYDSAGLAIGAGRPLNDRWSVGVSVNQSQGDATLNDGAGDSDVDSTLAAFFARFTHNRFSVLGGMLVGTQSLDTARTVSFDGLTERLRSSTDASVSGIFASVETQIDYNQWTITPSVQVDLQRTSLDSYREDGTNPLRLAVDDMEADTGFARLRTQFTRTATAKQGWTLTPRLNLGLSRTFPLGDRDVDALFIDSSSAVELSGDTAARWQGEVGIGFDARLTERLRLAVDAEYVAGQGSSRTEAKAGLYLQL